MSSVEQAQQDARREGNASGTPGQEDLPAHGEVIQPADFTPLHGPLKRRRAPVRPIHLVLGVSLLVLALVAGFLFSARSVFIQVEPEHARVDLDGGLHFSVGEGYLLLGGDYRLSLTAEGYHPVQTSIHVEDEQNQTFRFALEKRPGHLTVKAPVDEPGEVWIDGKQRGSLNQVISDLPAGAHQLQIVTERYKPFSRSIQITGLDQHQDLQVELEPAWANVELRSEPEGAEVTVDGQVIGETPLTAELLEGERSVAMKLPGHKAWDEILEVEAGETLALPSVALEPADGLVMVESSPAQASITVNGDYYGLTPREVSLAPGKSYEITLFKEGYEPAQSQLQVESGREQSVELQLTPKLGQVRVTASPEDALLYVDDRLMGRANQTLELPARQTRIAVKKDGYADYQTTVQPRPNFDQSLEVKLLTAEEAKWEHIPETITTEAGQNLKLFRPQATFTMGSSRREQGRRANEAMRDVALSRPFYLGTHEVTNREYRQFDPEHSSGHAKGESLDGEDYPVVRINWQQAALYCNWLSEQEGLPAFYRVENGTVTGFNPEATGYRLATEAEWAWAARYRNGEMLKFPWGPQLPPTEKSVNIADRNAAPLVGYVQPAYDDGYAATAPVGSFAANPRGLYDLAGNVSEWVNDFYEIAVSLSTKAEQDPLGPTEGSYHVIRGSSWAHGGVTELRLSFRDYGDQGRSDLGFRIARFVE
ncbi:PEGA domain-containing protein [Gilvimarinus sp. F26214L]|uniref:PEGA domain-containing protein n=1 Tax=Gilvimarinus sp. DZF01 TaxID=3461371 RepID=UPI004045D316